MHHALQGATFHIEHVIPKSRGGASTLENLAWACPACNLHKADRVQIEDSVAGGPVPLFNPRVDHLDAHFCWERYYIRALTPVGRVTIDALDLNSQRRLQIREAEESLGLFAGLEST